MQSISVNMEATERVRVVRAVNLSVEYCHAFYLSIICSVDFESEQEIYKYVRCSRILRAVHAYTAVSCGHVLSCVILWATNIP